MPILTPTPEAVAACVARAAQVGPTLHALIARYHARDLPNDPATARQLHEAGAQIVPEVRFADQIETAIWAANSAPEAFAAYVRSLYAENRIYTTPAKGVKGDAHVRAR